MTTQNYEKVLHNCKNTEIIAIEVV